MGFISLFSLNFAFLKVTIFALHVNQPFIHVRIYIIPCAAINNLERFKREKHDFRYNYFMRYTLPKIGFSQDY